MGTVISKGANGIGTLIGNAFAAPFKAVFGGSCEGVCAGTWDITCFIEHLCVSDLVKLLMVSGLCYITLVFFYLMFKIGICQCITRSLCKMCWAACETCLFSLEGITCFLWHKLKNVKRVNRRRRTRFRDVEVGYSSSDGSESLDVERSLTSVRKRKLVAERRKDRLRSSRYSGYGSHNRNHHHRLSSRGLKNSRQLQIRKVNNLQREKALFKRRRLR